MEACFISKRGEIRARGEGRWREKRIMLMRQHDPCLLPKHPSAVFTIIGLNGVPRLRPVNGVKVKLSVRFPTNRYFYARWHILLLCRSTRTKALAPIACSHVAEVGLPSDYSLMWSIRTNDPVRNSVGERCVAVTIGCVLGPWGVVA